MQLNETLSSTENMKTIALTYLVGFATGAAVYRIYFTKIKAWTLAELNRLKEKL